MTKAGDSHIDIRPATLEDVPLLAQVILAAVELSDMSCPPEEEPCREFEVAKRVCAEPDTLFSYRNALVPCLNGAPIGAMVSYDGAMYAEAREKTFRMFHDALGNENSSYGIETGPGEYYIDSIALYPQYRGHGIALQLMQYLIDHARRSGFTRITLLCDSSASQKMSYYASLGFVPEYEMDTFGMTFTKMALTLD